MALNLYCTVPSLYQTMPSGEIDVCPHNPVEFTCVGELELQWRDVDTPMTVTYNNVSSVNQTSITGVFRTVLTDISGNKLTSTATIDNVSLNDDGEEITCRDSSGIRTQSHILVQLKGAYTVYACI